MSVKRIIEWWRREVYPDEGGGNPQTGEVWSRYEDGTIRSGSVWNEVPGTVNRYETYRKAASGWQNLDTEQQEELQAVINQSILNEDKINLQHARNVARQMYQEGVNSPARLKRLQGAT